MKNNIKEFLIDPQSGQYSASRALLCLVVGLFVPIGIVLRTWPEIDILGHLVKLTGVLATVYAVNSGTRVWREGSQAVFPDRPPRKAKEGE